MRSDWHDANLDQVGRIVTGKTPSSNHPEHFGGHIPFVTPTDFDGRRVIGSTSRYLTEQGAKSVGSSCIPAHAVMVSCIGSDMGKAAVAGRECITNQQINSIVVYSNHDPLFVYYSLSARKTEIRAAAGGSAQPILNKSAFGRLNILLPPLDDQRAIAYILGTLDAKIELNRRINETLEAMAQAVFKAWFIEFVPVHAKQAGKHSLGILSNPAIFPEGFKNSELGDIPKGWSVSSVYDCASFINGVAFSRVHFSMDASGLPIVKIAELKDGVSEQTKFTNDELPAKYRIEDGEILFSWSGSPDTSIDTFVWAGGDGWLNQHIFKIVFSRPEEKHFVYYLLKYLKPTFIEIARNKQTTGLGHVTAQDMKRLKVAFPPDPVLKAFQQIVDPIFRRSFATLIETRTLTALRDTLLPKLMSGQLRVPSE